MKKTTRKSKLFSCLLACALVLTCIPQGNGQTALAAARNAETTIVLSDNGTTVNGAAIGTSSSDAVYSGAEIVYYKSGQDSSYGEGTSSDGHSESEAAAHTVITITEAGTYRISGTLSCGQLAVDLGEDAPDDATAVVTLILDNVSITCTVAPALIFYNVWESGDADATMTTELAQAVTENPTGANVILADGSTNTFNGSHVAKIYKTGTTKKLHKYDGAFYSKRSMTITSETEGTGILNINADNEGLDSELHLNVNGGNINIVSQDDGINTNEDYVSVTTINGGILNIDAGNGSEGDGIDSNGYLIINGGEVYSMANGSTPDGGIDADSDILINGGTVVASGARNDAVSTSSAAPYMELTYASTQKAGNIFKVTTSEGEEIISHAPSKQYQSLFFTSPKLAFDTTYYVYRNTTKQLYTGNSSSEQQDPGGNMGGGFPGGNWGNSNNSSSGSSNFVITSSTRSFSGVSDSSESTGKTQVIFHVNEDDTIADSTCNADGSSPVVFSYQGASTSDGTAASVPEGSIQLTVTDVPSEDYHATCLLSDGSDAIASVLPTDAGQYCLTLTVTDSNTLYTGTSQWYFKIEEREDNGGEDNNDGDNNGEDNNGGDNNSDNNGSDNNGSDNNSGDNNSSAGNESTTPGTDNNESLIATPSAPSVGSTVTQGEVSYTVTSDSTVTFQKLTSLKKKLVTIPASVEINGKSYQVTEISAQAFAGNKKLTTVVIGKNVKVIAKKAFYNCRSLKKVIIKSKKLKKIGKAAFKNIKKKAVFKVPASKKPAYRKLLTKKTGFGKKMKIK